MYVYEKQAGRIKVSKIVPNMEEIKRLKEYEVYSKLDYLTMMRAESDLENPDCVLLRDRNCHLMSDLVNTPSYTTCYHKLENDNCISETDAFSNLDKVINATNLRVVKYYDKTGMHYIALTNPRYETVAIREGKEIKEMTGIVPVSEKLYNANHLVELLSQSDLEKLYTSMPEGYFAENPQLLELNSMFTPNLWLSNLEDLYSYGIISDDLENFKRKLEISNEIISRVRRK